MTGTPYSIAASTQVTNTFTTAYTFSVTTATNIGDSIVVAAGNGDSQSMTLTDSAGNVYSSAANNGGTNPVGAIFYCQVTIPLTTSNTFTLTYPTNPAGNAINLIARGIPKGCAFNSANTPAWSASVTSGSPLGTTTGTLTNGNCYVMAVICNGNGGGTPTSPSSGFTVVNTQHTTGDPYLTVMEAQPTAVTALTPGATITSALWAVGSATFINPSQAGVTMPSAEDVLSLNNVSVGQALATTNLW